MAIKTTRRFLDGTAALADEVGHLPLVAHDLPELDHGERIELVEQVVAFLADALLPRAYAEERVLYPELGRLLGDPDAGAPVARDRAEVRRLLRELATADVHETGRLQEILYALNALLLAHLWRTEEAYLRLSEEESEEELEDLLERVDAQERRSGGRFSRHGIGLRADTVALLE